MKHNYLVMWHPVLKWGSPLPTLQPSKNFVAKATGVTQATIRKQGWLWCKVTITTPETGDPSVEVDRLNELIDELIEERDEALERLRVRDGPQVDADTPRA